MPTGPKGTERAPGAPHLRRAPCLQGPRVYSKCMLTYKWKFYFCSGTSVC